MFNSNSIWPVIIIFICVNMTMAANPFLGSSDGPIPVRPPARSIPQKLINAQLQFKDQIVHLFSQWSNDEDSPEKIKVLFPLLGFSFLYGVLHALGPGHRKTVVFSLFIARKTNPFEPLAAGFLSSFLHGFSAVGVILFYRTLTKRLFLQKVDSASIYLEGITYLLLAALALILLIYEIVNQKNDENRGGKEIGLYSTIATASLFPCPIAIMILIFSITINQFVIGIFTVSALSLGMGVVVSMAGFLARMGWVALFSRVSANEKRVKNVGKILEMGSYCFLLLFSLWMALPFLENFLPF